MKFLLVFLFFTVSLLSNEQIEIKGNLGIEYKMYNYVNPLAKDVTNRSINGEIEFKTTYEQYFGFLKIEALKDKENYDRKYIKTNEFYLNIELEDYEIRIGRDIKFWGALELYNITDIYNDKNIELDPFDKDKKLGSDGISITRYLENEDELSVILNQKDDIDSLYAKYSGSRNFIADVDFNILIKTQKDKNTFLSHNTIVKDDTLYKIEFKYIDATNNFYQFGTGVEHTLYGILDKKDLGLILEYYKSDDEIINFQDDLFAGIRINFNDKDSSDIVAGVIKDLEKEINSYSIEYNTRFYESFKTKLHYMKNDDLLILGINIGYYF